MGILGGCGDDGGSLPATDPVTVTGDEACTGDAGVTTRSCRRGYVSTRCACAPVPLDDVTVRRVPCAELPVNGAPRTPEDDACDAAGGSEPDLTCVTTRPTAGESQLVTLVGVVDLVGAGPDTDGLTVEIDGLDAVGTSSVASSCAETRSVYRSGEVVAERRLGFFVLEEVPTETDLVVHTSGSGGLWRDVWSYGVRIANEDVVAAAPAGACDALAALGPYAVVDVKTISAATYLELPRQGALGITRDDAGLLAGEVRDCAGVRLEHAEVGTWPAPAAMLYDGDDPDELRLRRGHDEGTGLTGNFVAFDLPAGPVDVTAVGRLGSAVTSLGGTRVRVRAGALTTVTLEGLQPQ
ncbi:MAG: hypothetical protein CMN30_06580 [Sandaracinus sp.]|nr:hypothetical protein [Sandaracinus sp.]